MNARMAALSSSEGGEKTRKYSVCCCLSTAAELQSRILIDVDSVFAPSRIWKGFEAIAIFQI